MLHQTSQTTSLFISTSIGIISVTDSLIKRHTLSYSADYPAYNHSHSSCEYTYFSSESIRMVFGYAN